MIPRFRQEIDCALSHRLNPHPGASIAYKTNDRNIALLRLKPCQQFQTRNPGICIQLSIESRGMASQFTLTNARELRCDLRWMARAIQSIDSRRVASVVSDGRSTDSNKSGSLRAARISTE